MNFFETIINFFNLIWDFLLNTISMINEAIMLVYFSINGITGIVYLLPHVIGAGCMICISVLAVRFLLLK